MGPLEGLSVKSVSNTSCQYDVIGPNKLSAYNKIITFCLDCE